MMNAAPLPMAQGAGAGFAAFLANIGQSAGDGETGGFDRLLANAPPLSAPDSAPAPALSVTPGTGQEQPAADAAAEKSVAPDVTDIALGIVTEAAPAAVASPRADAIPDVTPDAAPDTATDTAMDTAPIESLLAVLAPAIANTVAPAAKPAVKADSANAAPAQDAPSTFLAAPKPAPAQPMATASFAEPQQAAGSIEGGAAMTVLFTQPAGERPAGIAGIAEAAKPETVATRTLDLSNDDVWIEQLARDIVAAKSDRGDISFRLMPRHLGRLDVAMRAEEGGVALKLDTQHEATATIVTAAQARLVDDLRQQGVRVVGAEVTCTPGETGRHAQQQGQGRASATPDAAHLIETATEAEPREEGRPAARRGRFA